MFPYLYFAFAHIIRKWRDSSFSCFASFCRNLSWCMEWCSPWSRLLPGCLQVTSILSVIAVKYLFHCYVCTVIVTPVQWGQRVRNRQEVRLALDIKPSSNTADPTSGLFFRHEIWYILVSPAMNKCVPHKKMTWINRFFYALSHGRLHFLSECLFFLNLTKFHMINLPERQSPVVSGHRTPVNYSLFTLRRACSLLRINGEWALLRVNRL